MGMLLSKQGGLAEVRPAGESQTLSERMARSATIGDSSQTPVAEAAKASDVFGGHLSERLARSATFGWDA